QKMRERARSILLKSQSLGDKSNLTKMALDTLSGPDTTQIPFSNIQSAEAAIREGEAAFMRGDMDKAIAAYKRALESDPNLYDAALYAGDSEFKKAMTSTDPRFRNDHFDAAGVWFAKAIAINANIDPRTFDKKDGSNEWLMYDLTRIAWQKSDFSKNYPNEPAYRHSLKEEAAALRMVAEACAKDLKSGKVKELEASLDTLVKLND